MMLAGCFPLLYGFLLSLLIFLSFPVTIATNVSASLSIVKIGALFDEENVSRYSGVLTRSIEELNGSVAGVQLDEPVILGASSNPGHILSLVCDEMITKNVSAILAISTETTLFSLSMVGEFLSTPIVGIGSRSFSFSNKNVHPMYLRLESAESFQAYAIKKILHRNGWFQYSILASEETPSQAFLQYLTNVTSSLTWTVKGTVFSRDKRDIDHVLHSAAKSKTRVFVLHATPEYSSLLFRAAKDFGLLDAGNVWIVAETVITNQPQYLKHYPIGLIAVQFVDSGHIESKIHDSVELIARASVNKNYISNIASNKSCWSKPTPDKLEYGREFYSALVQTSFMGQTGYINLDEEGNLNNATYIILNLVKDQNRLSYWKELGKWENGDFSMEAIIWPGNSVSLPNGVNTEKVLIVANIEKPFIVVSTPLDVSFDCLTGVLCLQAVNGTREDIEKAFAEYDEPTVHGNYTDMKRCCSGLGIDLIESLRIDVEFNYNLYLVADENHGAFENGQWNGMVADLLNGTADLALSSFSITSERSRVIDFSSPFFHSGFSTLVAKKQVEPQLDSFLEPLDWSVWILVFVTVNIVAIAITIFEWMSPYGLHPRGRNRHYTFGLPSALNIAFSILFSHTVKSKPPKCMTSRFLLNVWGAFSFIFFASYTANLAAYMAGQTSHLQIDGINDEKVHSPDGSLTIGTVTGSSIQVYLTRNHPKLAKFMDNYIQDCTEEAMAKLKSGKLDAFIYDSPVIEYRMANDPECQLVSVGKPFGEEGYGIGLPKGSTMKEPLSLHILEYETDGYLEELQQKWFGTMICYKEGDLGSSDIGDNKVRLAHVAGLFIMLLFGIGVGGMILLLEYIMYNYAVPRLHSQPDKRNWLVLSQRLHRAVNTEDLVSSKANMQEMITMVKKGQFTKMFQREQLRRKSSRRSMQDMDITYQGHTVVDFRSDMMRRESNMEMGSDANLKDLIDSVAWVKNDSKRPSLQEESNHGNGFNRAKEKEMEARQDSRKASFHCYRPNRLPDIPSDSDTSYDNLQRFSPSGELVRFSPHGDVISQSPSDSMNELEQLENTRWDEHEQDSFLSLNSNPGEDDNVCYPSLGNPESHEQSDSFDRRYRPRCLSSENSNVHPEQYLGAHGILNRYNGQTKFGSWTEDEDEEDEDEEDHEPSETHPMMMEDNLPRYSQLLTNQRDYANSSFKNPQFGEDYSNRYDPYDPVLFDPRQLSKEELVVKWRHSQRELTKRLGKALSEKAKLEMRVSELQSQLDDR